MSTINLKGATSGTLSLVPSAIAGTNTITFPAETGTLRSTVSSGTVLQVVKYQIGTVMTGTTVLPFDNTIPQNTEGNEYMSLAITPQSASSVLKILVVLYYTSNATASGPVSLALFRDSTANALTAGSEYKTTTGAMACNVLSHEVSSSAATLTTFKVRAGCSAAGTTTINGTGGGQIFGGVMSSSITIWEVIP